MKFIRKIAATCALTFLIAGSIQATEVPTTTNSTKTPSNFLVRNWKSFTTLCSTYTTKVVNNMPEYKTIQKQFNRYVVQPTVYLAPTVGGVVGQINPFIGGTIAGLGIIGRTNYSFCKASSAFLICYKIFKAGLETGSAFALTRGMVNGNGVLIAAGAFGSLLRLGCYGIEKTSDNLGKLAIQLK